MSYRLSFVPVCALLALASGCVASDVNEPITPIGPPRPLHVIAAPSDHGMFLSWPDHAGGASYTVKWRTAADSGWSEKIVGRASHAFIPDLQLGADHQFIVTGEAGSRVAFFDTLVATPRDRDNCSHVDYLEFQSFFCSQSDADAAMRAKGISASELRCRNKPVTNWGPDAPDCLYTTSSSFRFLLLRSADKVFSQAAVPPTIEETRIALRHAIWKRGDPFAQVSRPKIVPIAEPLKGIVTRYSKVESFLFDDGRPHKSRVTHFTPLNAVAGRYAIFHEGHGEPGTMIGASMIEFLLDRGWEVYAMDMPIHGHNRVDRTMGVDTTHFDWWKLDDGNTSPVAIFMLPVKYLVDHIVTTRPASENLLLMGRSGGGYASFMYSALDPRITMSVAVAGGRPISQRLDAIWGPLELGDFEQTAPEVFSGIRQEDIMIAGGSRGSIQMYNTFDGCCFRVARGDPFLAYLEAGGARTGRVVRGFADPLSPIHGLDALGFVELDKFLNEVTR